MADYSAPPVGEYTPSHIDDIPYVWAEGGLTRDINKKTILLVAHTVGKFLFGGERSFIDIIDGLLAAGYNVIAVLPRYNQEYTNAVQKKYVACLLQSIVGGKFL
ncbi:hypothetical protein HGG76_07945 [Ochrobactrum tritici]|uniref:Uncharacterized protein n=1 Tax=Brucella tritici TaxID=94626 RepID=A0A7X6FPQ7_9HYPH|nr:hypothetical protein [Brucella tritici]